MVQVGSRTESSLDRLFRREIPLLGQNELVEFCLLISHWTAQYLQLFPVLCTIKILPIGLQSNKCSAAVDSCASIEVHMNLILNRDFKMPNDEWYQLVPLGEFPHAAAGIVQVVDTEACTAMAARFKADAAVPNFAGLLVDFDHFSLDDRARSEAAGWIMGLEYRGPRAEGGNLKPESEKIAAGDSASHIENHKGLWGRFGGAILVRLR
jgi:hypothetical protein